MKDMYESSGLYEQERLKRLYSYELLDSTQDNTFQDVVTMAAHMFKVPIAFVALVDKARVWFKARCGLDGRAEISRDLSLCSIAILQNEVTVIKGAWLQELMQEKPEMASIYNVGFYAAAPLTTPDGYNIGTLCIVDREPKPFSQDDAAILSSFAAIVMEEIERQKVIVKAE
ncbi:GAF domain-containing protein [Pontibacter sp. SGAir0037]|uniref:GAF domain-containing protein n=1 Tax=Pontibacter sp. SGAir0037 TaxID=2571030 RepID=UPI0010CD59C0|nr:GAF domain-containing protein [Pontibacter sp. SGAir0037]QCR23584.1 GAF domain-containing protein [Pontibacter sp. SGAir0037]